MDQRRATLCVISGGWWRRLVRQSAGIGLLGGPSCIAMVGVHTDAGARQVAMRAQMPLGSSCDARSQPAVRVSAVRHASDRGLGLAKPAHPLGHLEESESIPQRPHHHYLHTPVVSHGTSSEASEHSSGDELVRSAIGPSPRPSAVSQPKASYVGAPHLPRVGKREAHDQVLMCTECQEYP